MNILVTGGYGFIGSHIAEKFYKEGHNIYIIDNLNSGNFKNINFDHNFYNYDVSQLECETVFSQNKIDIVIHMAAQIDVAKSMENPYNDSKINILGLINMLTLSVKYQVEHFIFPSSAAVYGDNTNIPLNEKSSVDPLSPYGINKLLGEFYCKKWSEIYNLNTLCLRFSNVYGPRQGSIGEGGVISIYIDRIINGEPIFVFGDGSQTRDFIYVKDVSEAIYKAFENKLKGLYNLSTGNRISINELISEMKKIHPINSLIFKEARKGDIIHSSLDNSLITKKLNWLPKYTIQSGLINTLNWYIANNKD